MSSDDIRSRHLRCDRCNTPVSQSCTLPFAQYREQYGVNPALCPDCRDDFRKWVTGDDDE